MQELVISIVFVVTVLFAAAAVYSKLLISYMQNTFHLLFYHIIFNFLIILGLFLAFFSGGNNFPDVILACDVIIIMISGGLTFAGIITLYQGFKEGNASIGGIFVSSRIIVSIPLAFFFLQEFFPPITYFWIVLILVGVLMVSWEKGILVTDVLLLRGKGVIWFLLTIVFWGVGNTVVGTLNNRFPIMGLMLIRLSFILFLMLTTYTFLNQRLGDGRPLPRSPRLMGWIFGYVLILAVADIGFIFALGESVTLSEAISALEGLFIFLMVLFMSFHPALRRGLDEPLDRQTLVVRFIGIIIATFGTIGIVFGT